MGNLDIYNKVRGVPVEAQKKIDGGTLGKLGFTDINPMWRIKALTEAFGPCGTGWWYTVDKQWIETAPNGEMSAFCNITVYYKDKETGEASKGIPGTGGSFFGNKNRTSDECYKMALTDAISVAAKALGVGADVYFEKDKTKYSDNREAGTVKTAPKTASTALKNVAKDEKTGAEIPTGEPKKPPYVDKKRLEDLTKVAEYAGYSAEKMTAGVKKRFGKTPFELTEEEYKAVYNGFLGHKSGQEGE